MSKIIKERVGRVLSHFVELNGKIYYIDSVDTSDEGLETMAFLCDGNYQVADWNCLYCERYPTEEEMKTRHFEICNNLEDYLKQGDKR